MERNKNNFKKIGNVNSTHAISKRLEKEEMSCGPKNANGKRLKANRKTIKTTIRRQEKKGPEASRQKKRRDA